MTDELEVGIVMRLAKARTDNSLVIGVPFQVVLRITTLTPVIVLETRRKKGNVGRVKKNVTGSNEERRKSFSHYNEQYGQIVDQPSGSGNRPETERSSRSRSRDQSGILRGSRSHSKNRNSHGSSTLDR